MTVSGALTRFGASSVMYSAVAIATGTPRSRAIAEVMIVPTTSGSAPYSCCDGTHELSKTKPM